MTLVYALYALLVIEQMADAYLTIIVIRNGGYEMNDALVALDQFLRGLGVGGRWAWLAVAKLVMLSVMWWAIVENEAGVVLLTLACVGYALVIVHNVKAMEWQKQH